MKPIFYIIGFAASGKTTLAKHLQHELSLWAWDLDTEIEKYTQMPLSAFWERYGEKAFRQAEKEALQVLIPKAGGHILATGGGTPCYHRALMEKTGYLIYWNPPWATIRKRLKKGLSQRPLYASLPPSKWYDLWKKRQACYRPAHLITHERRKVRHFIMRKLIYTFEK
ncbi:MAG: shikimate kinase [Bacteroidia bacterium]